MASALPTLKDLAAPTATRRSDPGDPAAAIELDPGGLNFAADPVCQADREWTQPLRDRSAALEKAARPLLATRHQELLAFVKNEHCQLAYSAPALSDLVALPLRVSLLEMSRRGV
jgi:hypothetical protein